MTMPVTDERVRFPSGLPRVFSSPALEGSSVIAIEGEQFEDGLTRLITGPDVEWKTMSALSLALREMDRIAGMRRWLQEALDVTR